MSLESTVKPLSKLNIFSAFHMRWFKPDYFQMGFKTFFFFLKDRTSGLSVLPISCLCCSTTKSEPILSLHKDGQCFTKNTEVVYWIRRKNTKNPLRPWAPFKFAPCCHSSAGWLDLVSCLVGIIREFRKLREIFYATMASSDLFSWALEITLRTEPALPR